MHKYNFNIKIKTKIRNIYKEALYFVDEHFESKPSLYINANKNKKLKKNRKNIKYLKKYKRN